MEVIFYFERKVLRKSIKLRVGWDLTPITLRKRPPEPIFIPGINKNEKFVVLAMADKTA